LEKDDNISRPLFIVRPITRWYHLSAHATIGELAYPALRKIGAKSYKNVEPATLRATPISCILGITAV
jgi:hypothetical protein